jgi:hypothetical protein
VKQLWALQLVEMRSCAARVKALEAEALRITRAQRVAVEQQQKAASFCASMQLKLGDSEAAVEAATMNYNDEDKEVEKKIEVCGMRLWVDDNPMHAERRQCMTVESNGLFVLATCCAEAEGYAQS